ncbi:MAG: cytidylate kinase-like family protein [Candidatus Latescibacterota bacterium]|nr:cytidylate kinase-like family protein [Candidatus Latescibacterota bacterium]
MAVITVSRQLGSGGDQIAERIAQVLGYELVDRRLIEQIGSITDTSTEEVEKYDEKGEGRVRYFLKRLLVPDMSPGGFPLSSSAYFPEFGVEFPYVVERSGSKAATYLDRGAYQLLITTLLQDYGDAGRAVIVGRASQVILGSNPNALHVKVIAPFKQRCQRVQEFRDVTEEHARELVEQHDKWRKLYLRNYHDADWDDLLLYHLTINMGKVTMDEAVELIAGHVQRLG